MRKDISCVIPTPTVIMTRPPSYLFIKYQITLKFPTGLITRPHVYWVISGGVTANTSPSHSWTYLLIPSLPSLPTLHLNLDPGASLLFWSVVAQLCSPGPIRSTSHSLHWLPSSQCYQITEQSLSFLSVQQNYNFNSEHLIHFCRSLWVWLCQLYI